MPQIFVQDTDLEATIRNCNLCPKSHQSDSRWILTRVELHDFWNAHLTVPQSPFWCWFARCLKLYIFIHTPNTTFSGKTGIPNIVFMTGMKPLAQYTLGPTCAWPDKIPPKHLNSNLGVWMGIVRSIIYHSAIIHSNRSNNSIWSHKAQTAKKLLGGILVFAECVCAIFPSSAGFSTLWLLRISNQELAQGLELCDTMWCFNGFPIDQILGRLSVQSRRKSIG